MTTGHKDIPGNCRADELARRGTTSKLCDEFFILGILFDSAIVDLIKSSWAAFKFQRSKLSTVNGVITRHYIIGTRAWHIDLVHLTNDFSKKCILDRYRARFAAVKHLAFEM